MKKLLYQKNIGFVFDRFMDCQKQVSLICKSGWYHLRNIGRIRQYLTAESTERLVHAFITSKLDTNNSLLYGLPDTLLHKLQVLQNAAARLVARHPKHLHVTPILQQLHWLPVKQQITFKILLMVYKALNELAPVYIEDLLMKRLNSTISLRSDNCNLLLVPRSNSVHYGDRNFRCAAPLLWNNLPAEIRMCDTVESFKRKLKAQLFTACYEL